MLVISLREQIKEKVLNLNSIGNLTLVKLINLVKDVDCFS